MWMSRYYDPSTSLSCDEGESHGFPPPSLSRGPLGKEGIFMWLLKSRVHKFVTPLSITNGKIFFLPLDFGLSNRYVWLK